MIKSILLVDDESLFHLVFEDACSLLDITLNLQTIDSTDKAEQLVKEWYENDKLKPACVFVDLNMIGSTFDGIELVNRINNKYGNGCVIGIISSSSDKLEQMKAIRAGAQFWIVKTDEIEPRLLEFKRDFPEYVEKTKNFKVYDS